MSKTLEILYPAIRQYRHNNTEGLVHGYDQKETETIIQGLITKQLRNASMIKTMQDIILESDDYSAEEKLQAISAWILCIQNNNVETL